MTAFLVYSFHWLFVAASLNFSWRRCRHVLHPHFLFTGMIAYYLNDFLIRGYDDQSLRYIDENAVLYYQMIILLSLAILVAATSVVSRKEVEVLVAGSLGQTKLDLAPAIRAAILFVALAVLAATLYRRFAAVGWSLDEVIRQSLAPRGEREWDRDSMAGNAVSAMIGILQPFAAIAPAYLFATGKGAWRYVSLGLFAFVVAILVTDGSRTPVAIAFATLGMFWALRFKSLAVRMGVVGLVVSTMLGTFALIYAYRATGYIDANDIRIERELEYNFEQDDNYYRAIYAYDHSDQTGKRWNAFAYFTAIAVNPIPRALWPGKPALDEEFYDGFKCGYCTMSFLGETVAMTGVTWSIIVIPILGFVMYLLLFNAARLLAMPMGVAVYLVVALYVYLCIRSLQNLSNYAYFPAFAVCVTLVLDRMQRRRLLNAEMSAAVARRLYQR